MSMKTRRAVLAIPLIIFAIICGLAYAVLDATSRGERDGTAIGFSMTGQSVPDFTIPSLENNGTTFSLAEMRGRAYAINVFASWCAPCRLEAPAIEEISNALPVIGINYRDTPEDARAFLARFGNPFYQIGRDGDGSASIRLGVHGLPETFIIDADGTIIHHHQGPVFASDLKGVIADAISLATAE